MRPESSFTVWGGLLERASEAPLAPAILSPGRKELTYRGLLEQIREVVDALNGFGFGRGDRVAVALPPGPECPAALVAVMSGCVCLPLNPAYSVAEFSAFFVNARVAALVTQPREVSNAALAARSSGIPVIELEPLLEYEAGRFRLHDEGRAHARLGGFSEAGELAAIFATSGSTSAPKLIPLTHTMVCDRAQRARHSVDLTSSDRCLDLMPSFHGGALLVPVLGSMFAGACSLYPGVTAPWNFERCIRDAKPTWCALPPAFLEMLIAENSPPCKGADYPGLRAFFTCGAPVSPETVEAIERAFRIPLQNYYGASECGGVAVNPLPPGIRKPGSVGVSFGLELAILDESGLRLSHDQTGEVAVRGGGVFGGYENSDGSSDAVRPERWYRTGDRGYLDPDGYVFLTGRLGNTINRGGEKISPEEIEAVLREHPEVRDAVVFPVPHETLGQNVAALIVTRTADVNTAAVNAGVSVDEVRHFAAERLAPFKVPHAIVIAREIPRGPAGKIHRNQLASLFARELSSAASSGGAGACDPPTNDVERILLDIWARTLKADRIGIRDSFLDLGGNSLLAVEMLAEVERKLGRSIPTGRFWQSPCIANLASVAVSADRRKAPIMLPVQTSGLKPALFYVLPGWFVAEAELLSGYLGQDQPVYALIPDPRAGAGQSGLTREEIIAECIAAMKSVQQEGPYSVIGRSVAGIVALDIAQSLWREGKTIGLVGLLDTHYPGIPRMKLLPAPLRQIEFLIGELVATPRSRWGEYVRRLPGRALRSSWRTVSGRRLPSQIANVALYTGLHRLFDEIPEPWPGRITLFAAESSKHRGFLDRRLYWSKAAGHGLEVHLIPGDHDRMVQEPHIRDFVAALEGCLVRACVRGVQPAPIPEEAVI
jgi:acyl-coenzyme A synthetase/AMP-(fatty) acid ligase/thioesterase domain-containing protein/acyl carrier protein